MDLNTIFLILGLMILIGFTGRLIRQKSMIPESLFLILFGILLGPVTGIAPGKDLLDLVPAVSIAAMVAILIESGLEFDISRLRGSLQKAAAFTILIAALTTCLVAAFLVYLFGWGWGEAALLGLISSGTTTITSMALLKSVDVSDKLRRLILLETVINDFTLILGTFLIVEFIKVSDLSFSHASRLVMAEFSVGIMLGLVTAVVWRYVLKEIYKKKELSYISTLGVCFLLYYFSDYLGGNPIIAIFAFSLLLGNYRKLYNFIRPSGRMKKGFDSVLRSIRSVQADMTFFLGASFFVLLGITFNISLFENVSIYMITGLLALILVARTFSSEILSRMDKDFSEYKMIISIMIPRGYVAAVLAFVPAQEGIQIPLITDIIVILIVLTTLIAIVGTALYARISNNKMKKAE